MAKGKTLHWGQYYPGDSFVHQLDPRCKIIVVFLYIIALFFVKTWLDFIPPVVFGALAVFSSRVPLKMLFRSMRGVLFIVIFAGLMNVFFTPGETILWQWNFIKITVEGLNKGGIMALRLAMLVSFASLLTLTTSPLSLTHGLESLLNPLKKIGVPAHELSMMLSIALRFIPILMEEMDVIIKAQRARGADMQHGPLKERLRMVVAVVVPLFVSALKRADELADAMEARGYAGGNGRTTLHQLCWQGKDSLAMVLVVSIFLAIILL